MISVIVFVVFLIIGGFITVKGKMDDEPRTFVKGIVVVVLGVLLGLFQPFAVERIDAGHTGIIVNLSGEKRGVQNYQYTTGWVIYNTWFKQVLEFPTYQQHIEYDDQVVITKGGFSATIKPSFNYSLVPTAVGDMFVNLRLGIKEVEQGWLKTAIVGSVNDVANKWNVDDVFNKREEFESAIIIECNKRVSKWFTISQLRTNIVPPQALQNSIIEKTKAIQEVQVAENQKRVAEAEAQRKIAVAKGDSAELIIRALAEAQSTKIKQQQLTPMYLEYMKLTKWDGTLPSTVLGTSNGVMVNVK